MLRYETGKPSLMRSLNKHIVLNIIRASICISKAEISKISDLKPPTVSNIVGDLLEKNLIMYVGKGTANKKGGSKPDLYKINPDGKYFIGIDIGVKGIVGIVLNFEGKIIQKACSRDGYESQEDLTIILKSLIKELLKKSNLEIKSIESISVSIVAHVDTKNSISKVSNVHVLNEYHVKDVLEAAFGVEVYVDTDVNFLAVERDWSEYKKDRDKNVLCLAIRTGIGLGIIINGELYRGSNGISGNIAHLAICDNKVKCDCGKTGCLETIVGESALTSKVREYANSNTDLFSELNIISVEDINIDTVYQALKQNNPIVTQIVQDSFRYLGLLAGNLIQLFNPHYVIIGGEIFNYGKDLFIYLVNTIKEYCWNIAYENVQFEELLISDTTIAYAAAVHALKESMSLI